MDIGAYLILSLFLEVPRLIGAIVSFFIARWAGNYAFRKSANGSKSLLLAIAVFLIVDFALSIVWRSEMSLMSAAASGAVYYYFLVFIPKVIAVALLYFSLHKRFAVVQTEINAAPPTAIHTLTYALVAGAIVAIALPIYSIFHTSTVIEQGMNRLTEVQNQTETIVQQQAQVIRGGLEAYKQANNSYPNNLDMLVPMYLADIPKNPYEFPQDYTATSGGTDYELCVYTTIGQKCITARGSWSDLRKWCDRNNVLPGHENQRFPVIGKDC